MLTRYLLIILMALAPLAGAATDPANRCDWLIWDQARQNQALDEVFARVFCDSHIYQEGDCHSNVIALYRQFKRYHPDITPNEFNVLYITTEQWPADIAQIEPESGFHVTTAREGYENGESVKYVEWKYHVALEFRGRIYDLDYTDQPNPVSAEDYLLNFFMSEELIDLYDGELRGDMSELIVYVVPGYFYLGMSQEDSHKKQTHADIMQDHVPRSLVGYLLSVDDL